MVPCLLHRLHWWFTQVQRVSNGSTGDQIGSTFNFTAVKERCWWSHFTIGPWSVWFFIIIMSPKQLAISPVKPDILMQSAWYIPCIGSEWCYVTTVPSKPVRECPRQSATSSFDGGCPSLRLTSVIRVALARSLTMGLWQMISLKAWTIEDKSTTSD